MDYKNLDRPAMGLGFRFFNYPITRLPNYQTLETLFRSRPVATSKIWSRPLNSREFRRLRDVAT
jgi:hypothetical protein